LRLRLKIYGRRGICAYRRPSTVSQQSLVTLAKAAKRIREIQEAEKLEDSFYEFCKAAWQVGRSGGIR